MYWENKTKVKTVSKSSATLLCKRPSKDRNKGKHSHTKHPHSIYSSSAALWSSLMLLWTIWIFLHALIHHWHNSYRYNHATSFGITTPQSTFFAYYIILPPLYSNPALVLHFPTSSAFCNTNSFVLFPKPSFLSSCIDLNHETTTELSIIY